MLTPLSASQGRSLRQFFADSGYTAEAMERLRAGSFYPSRVSRNLPRFEHLTREPSAFNILIRWFFMGYPIQAQTATELLEGDILAVLTESGMIVRQGEQLSPTIMIVPYDDFLVASDLYEKICNAESDAILTVNTATRRLLNFTVRIERGSALDLGCGGGALALLASSHCARVTATDLNPHAEIFGRFNAWLNGVENIEWLTGDLYEPVAGRTFDLIVSNPPFFVSPKAEHMFCDNPMELDTFCRRVVKEGACRLAEGGYMQMLCEWVSVKGQDWKQRLAEWVDGTGCDAWILQEHREDALMYAQKRITELSGSHDAALKKTFDDWAEYFESKQVEAVHLGMIALRKCAGRTRIRFDDVPGLPQEPFGESVLRVFRGLDLSASAPADAALLDWKLRVAPHVERESKLELTEEGWAVTSLRLRMTSGLRFTLGSQPFVWEFLHRLDGAVPLRGVIHDMSKSANAPPDQVERECLAVCRNLIERGFLTL